jgi:murein L,D-transpeptidase YafK
MKRREQLGTLLISTSLLLICTIASGDSVPTINVSARLPAYLLEMPDTVGSILVADTETATMHRFVSSANGVVAKDQRYMSIGLNGIGKERAWDKKTPLGIYFITERLDTSRLHEKYGVAAFPLDYPNAWDLYNKRTGNGIWLHGVDHNNPERPPLDTDGCLSLPNDEILRLADDLQPLVTPVIVARQLRWATPEELQVTRIEFRLALDMWRQSQEQGDFHAYLSLYADDFSYRDMDRKNWSSWRMQVFAASPLESVQISDLMLLADPEVNDLYLSRFTQVMTGANGPVRTTKRLYWRRSSANHTWRIVAEGAG